MDKNYEAPEIETVGDVRTLTQANTKPSHNTDHLFWANSEHYVS